MGMMMSLRRAQMMPREKGQPRNEIWYTSTDGKVVAPYDATVFGQTITSNTYEEGKGVIRFSGAITTIGYRAFYGRTKYMTISIPDGVTELGNQSFYGLKVATEITLPSSIQTVGTQVFRNCFELLRFKSPLASPDGRCLIINNSLVGFAQGRCKSYEIPEGITSLHAYVFYNATALEGLVFPTSLTTIDTHVFTLCSALKTLRFKSVTAPSIHKYSFGNSPTNAVGLTSARTGENILYIPTGATGYDSGYWVSNLTSASYSGFTLIPWEEKNRCITYASFNDNAITPDGDDIASILSSNLYAPNASTPFGLLKFKSDVKVIPHSAYYQSDLYGIRLPDSVKTIRRLAFSQAMELTSITIGEGVVTLEAQFLQLCWQVTNITIPNTCESIGSSAFYDCSELVSIYMKPTTPPTITSSTFDSTSDSLKIYVPRASLDAYIAEWVKYDSTLSSKLTAYDF